MQHQDIDGEQFQISSEKAAGNMISLASCLPVLWLSNKDARHFRRLRLTTAASTVQVSP